jgi:hypothetical protein
VFSEHWKVEEDDIRNQNEARQQVIMNTMLRAKVPRFDYYLCHLLLAHLGQVT